MGTAKEEMLTGDSAKLRMAEDEFGLDKITESIATVLNSRILANSYAIGLEGEWGAGKSSLINFISERLAKDELTHKVIRFDPWLVGTKEALLRSFFDLLIQNVREFGSDTRVQAKLASNITIIERSISHLSLYAGQLEKGGAALDFAAAFDPSGKTKFAAVALKGAAALANWAKPKEKPLEALKSQVKGDLQVLSNLMGGLRFTVIIDDLDRLDPDESVEILRLIKAVADFPIITYLVCFDRDVLAAHVERVIKVKDGHAYIEKIFQAFIPLPPQEPFALRRFTRKLLMAAFPNEMQQVTAADRQRVEREQLFFDIWVGRLIETPRDAIRLCEAVKLGWPSIRDKADFLDYTWLQLVKLQFHPLHTWVRNYVVNIGSYRDAGRPGDREPIIEGARLRDTLQGGGWETDQDRVGLCDLLPGLRTYTAVTPKVFELAKGELERFEKDRRLGSPSHWRYYFSFDAPSYALDDDMLPRFLKAAVTSPDEARALLQQLAVRVHGGQPGHHFAVFLERLFDQRERLSPDESIGVAVALSEVMDGVNRGHGFHFEPQSAWSRAISLMSKPVSPHFPRLVQDAQSINWLADVIRDQGFAMGLPDPARARADRVWISKKDFDASLRSLLERFNTIGIAGVIQKPEPLIILYCWKQLGSEADLRTQISLFTQSSDQRFLDFIAALRTWASSSDKGLQPYLRGEVISHFIDFESVMGRLRQLFRDGDENVRERAREFLEIVEDDRGS